MVTLNKHDCEVLTARLDALREENARLKERSAVLISGIETELRASRAEVATARKWSALWKALAKFRGWPASKHEENRHRAEAAEAKLAEVEGEVERLTAAISGTVEQVEQQRKRAERAEAKLAEMTRSAQEWLSSANHRQDRAVLAEAEVERLRVIIDAIGKDAEADRTVLDQHVALAKIRSRVGNVQRAALRGGGK